MEICQACVCVNTFSFWTQRVVCGSQFRTDKRAHFKLGLFYTCNCCISLCSCVKFRHSVSIEYDLQASGNRGKTKIAKASSNWST